MLVETLKRFYHTLKYLKVVQISYRFYYLLKSKFKKEIKIKNFNGQVNYFEHYNIYSLNKKQLIINPEQFKFEFLNLSHTFSNKIDWNFSTYGKLWTYNINYFEFLNQPDVSKETGVLLIKDYIFNYKSLIDGLEPYPTSLRLINWIKFLNTHKISDSVIIDHIYTDANRLSKNLEYHLLANHLLENAFALYWASNFLNFEKLRLKAKKLLRNQLLEQILNDGAHYERSPMYHQIILYRLLDLIFIANNLEKDLVFLDFLKSKASSMLSFLNKITNNDGSVPAFADTSKDIAPDSFFLNTFSEELNIKAKDVKLKDSNYRILNSLESKLVINIGEPTPNYQPGHAHADILNFVLYKKDVPVIVDTGISTYNKNKTRHKQRSTDAHNCVVINNQNQSDVWGGFRVGKRAKVKILKDNHDQTSATLKPFHNKKVIHNRIFKINNQNITIEDFILNQSQTDLIESHLHFHPKISLEILNGSQVVIKDFGIKILFNNAISINKMQYDFCESFNKTTLADKLVIRFNQNLITTITDINGYKKHK